jgi:WD40 repeat protein
MSTSESRSAVVLGLAEEFLERYRQGQRPSLKEYIDRHPDLAAEIKEVFPAMALMENVALAEESLAGAPTGPAIASSAAPPEQLGDYRIIREVGRGGMGLVYEAEQVSLGRHVAHKQGIQHRDIKPSNLLLDTRGTVWVTDFGLARADNEDHLTQTGDIVGTLRYLPPEAFEGQTDKRGDIYSLGLTLYEMLARKPAFEERDRHRLIKRVTTDEPPRLDKLNRAIPRDLVTIVHKAIDREPTRRYATAGELAADLQRFLDDELIQARRISNGERLWRWGRRNPAIASLLIAVVLLLAIGSIASTIAAIYLNKAKQAADEAARVADVERQRAVDAGRQETSAREREQERRREAEAERTTAEQARKAEARQRDRAEDSLYAARLSLIENALRAEDSDLPGQILDKCMPQSGKRDRRAWEWHYLKQWAHAEQASWLIFPGSWADAVAFSPDGRTYASVGGGNHYYKNRGALVEPGEAIISELPWGKVRFRLRGHGHLVVALAYSPGGKRLATASLDKTVKLWDIETGKLQATLKGHSGAVNAVAWGRDGRRLASGDSDGTIKLWDATTLKETASVKGHRNVAGGPDSTDGVSALSWNPDGQRLVSASRDGTVKLWDKDLKKLLIIPIDPGDNSNKPVAWSPDGARVACGNGTRVHIHDTTTGKLLHVLDDRAYVLAVAFSLDGMRLTVGGDDGVLRIWDSRTGQRIVALLGHQGRVTGLAFAGEGRRLLSCGVDGTVKLWDAERNPRGRIIPGAAEEIAALSFTADGTRFRTTFPPLRGAAYIVPPHLEQR